jgi:hypothetical protein
LILLLSARATGQAEKDDLAMRPGRDKGPTDVSVFMYVIDIGGIDGVSQSFDASVFVELSWKDTRLAHQDEGRRRYATDEVWSPRIMFLNQQSTLRTSLPEIVRVDRDGTVRYRQRYVGPFSQPLDLHEFPFDEHMFDLQIVAPGYMPSDIRFVQSQRWIEAGVRQAAAFSPRLSLPDWHIVSHKAEPREVDVGNEGSGVAGYVLAFEAERAGVYYVWKVLVPLIFIVMMAWTTFWIDPTSAGTQISVATTSMLTLIAYRFLLDHLVPRLPYMTRMDYFTLGSTVLVFLTLVEVVVTSSLARGGQKDRARRIDRLSRVFFPSAFVAVTLLSFLTAIWD